MNNDAAFSKGYEVTKYAVDKSVVAKDKVVEALSFAKSFVRGALSAVKECK